jgi:ABC-type Fe3+-citrate transport system substrate-binding protein
MRKTMVVMMMVLALLTAIGCSSGRDYENLEILDFEAHNNILISQTNLPSELIIRSVSELRTSGLLNPNYQGYEEALIFDQEFFQNNVLVMVNYQTSTSGGRMISMALSKNGSNLLVNIEHELGLLDALGRIIVLFSINKAESHNLRTVITNITFSHWDW